MGPYHSLALALPPSGCGPFPWTVKEVLSPGQSAIHHICANHVSRQEPRNAEMQLQRAPASFLQQGDGYQISMSTKEGLVQLTSSVCM